MRYQCIRILQFILLLSFCCSSGFGQVCNNQNLTFGGDITPPFCDGESTQSISTFSETPLRFSINAIEGNKFTFSLAWTGAYIELYDSNNNFIQDQYLYYDAENGFGDSFTWSSPISGIIYVDIYDSPGYGGPIDCSSFGSELIITCEEPTIPNNQGQQCNYNSSSILIGDYTPTQTQSNIQYIPMTSGEYFTMNVENGTVYTITTCKNFIWDTQIYIYKSSNQEFYFGNNSGCGYGSAQAAARFTADFTGQIEVYLSAGNCDGSGIHQREDVELFAWDGNTTYIVNTTDTIHDGYCTLEHCSLADASTAAYNDYRSSKIHFDIPTAPPYVLKGLLLEPNDHIIIDGYTQPNFNLGDIVFTEGIENDINENCREVGFKGLELEVFGIHFIKSPIKIKSASYIQIGNQTKSNIFSDKSFIWLSTDTECLGFFYDFQEFATSIYTYPSNITNNYFGIDFNKQILKNSYNSIYIDNSFYGLISIKENYFYGSVNAIFNKGPECIDIQNNKYQCNNSNINISPSSESKSSVSPIIDSLDGIAIYGKVVHPSWRWTSATVDIYLSSQCTDDARTHDEYLGSAPINNNETWLFPINYDFDLGDQIVAKANYKSFYNCVDLLSKPKDVSSQFSPIYIILPTDCIYAQELPVNITSCSTAGAVLDLSQITTSQPAPVSAFSNTFSGNDAWLQLVVPATRNFLIRSNTNNQLSPVIEAYKGNCDNLIFQGAAAFDSVVQEMVFENVTAGDTLYLRVWDNQNLKVNASEPLLHLTAHELGVNKDEWETCDHENSIALGNPTIISEKDANSFILDFPENVTAGQIQEEIDSLIAQGMVLEDECLCNSSPLQLWKSGDPVDMETRRKSAIGRGNVDTVNYNYIFEAQEFQVNAYATGNQYDTDVSMDPEGNFALCWIDQQRKHNYARLYKSSGNPITQEFIIGDPNEYQLAGKIALEDDGELITVWHESSGNSYKIYGRQFYADGTEKADQFDISEESANTSSNNDIKDFAKFGTNPSIDVDANGNFIVTWHVGDQVFAQRFDASANLQGSIIEVGTTIDNNITPQPAVSMNDSGSFIISWSGEDSDDNGIYAQLYNASGQPQGPIISVNTVESQNQIKPDVSLMNDGSFVITWQSYDQVITGLDYDIFAQRFDTAGNPIGSEILINSYTMDTQKSPSISGFDDGRFFIAWDSYGQDGVEEGVYGQLFATDGSKLGDEFKLNTFTDPDQEEPATATNGTNLIIGSWVDGGNEVNDPTPGGSKGIFAQRYEIQNTLTGINSIALGTATPSSLLGDEVPYTNTVYSPLDSVSRVRVAIIDTGIDPDHPYLVNTIWNNQQISGAGCHNGDVMGYDYYNNSNNPQDVDGHGTKVNGIIAKDFNPDIQLEMMNVKFHENDKGKVFDALCGLYYAVDNGADVINMSWGFEASEEPAILRKALEYASDNGVLIVTTAGNTSKNNDNIKKYPANFKIDNMIVVTAYTFSNSTGNIKLSNYASYGKNNVHIAAPGFVETTNIGDTLSLSAGTSLAAPFVARTAATIRGLYPVLTAEEVKDCILNTAQAEATLTNFVATGGILDHNAALACARDKAMNCMGIDLFITVNQNTDTTYRSDAWVNSDATVTNNSDVKMYGAEYVGLQEGFEVESGAEYLADIDDCDPGNEPMDFISSGYDQPLFTIAAHSPNTGKIKSKFYSDGINPVSITVKEASGSDLLNWESDVLEKGWYEKIIDVAEAKSGDYEIAFEGMEYRASKTLKLKRHKL